LVHREKRGERMKFLIRFIKGLIWVVNLVWITACLFTGSIVLVVIVKWATANISAESYLLVVAMATIAATGLVLKVVSMYWSDKGKQNGLELIKWNGKFPDFKTKVEAKDE
jgi:hypothetical protein